MNELDVKHNEVYYSHKHNELVVVQIEFNHFASRFMPMFSVYLVQEDDDVLETDKYIEDMVLVGEL